MNYMKLQIIIGGREFSCLREHLVLCDIIVRSNGLGYTFGCVPCYIIITVLSSL